MKNLVIKKVRKAKLNVALPVIYFEKPICRLTGEDGNVFSIIGRVSKALKRAGYEQKAAEFTNRAMFSDSYDTVLMLCFEYVEVV